MTFVRIGLLGNWSLNRKVGFNIILNLLPFYFCTGKEGFLNINVLMTVIWVLIIKCLI